MPLKDGKNADDSPCDLMMRLGEMPHLAMPQGATLCCARHNHLLHVPLDMVYALQTEFSHPGQGCSQGCTLYTPMGCARAGRASWQVGCTSGR